MHILCMYSDNACLREAEKGKSEKSIIEILRRTVLNIPEPIRERERIIHDK